MSGTYGVHGFGAHGGMGGGGRGDQYSAVWLTQYIRRLWAWEQMDFESCFDQMAALVGPPQSMAKVYKLAMYRKRTKNQWARDDPAFALVQVMLIFMAALAWSVVCLRARFTVARFVLLFCNELVGYWLLGGMAVAGTCASVANRYLIENSINSVAQTVEWLYAFDIHCNGFFVSFLFTHVLQFLLLPILLSNGFISTLLANALWTLAISSYFYVTHLGYTQLPFLRHTEYYLYPIAAACAAFVVLTLFSVLGYHVNITRVAT